MARKCFQLNDEILAAKGIDWRNGEIRHTALPPRPPGFLGGDGPGAGGGVGSNPSAASLMAWRMITAGGPNPRDPGMAGGFGSNVPVTSFGASPIQQPTPAFPAPHPGMPWIAGTNVDQYSSILSDIFTPFWEGISGMGSGVGGELNGMGPPPGHRSTGVTPTPTPPVGIYSIAGSQGGGW